MALTTQSMYIPHITPTIPKPIYIPNTLAINTLKSHIESIATIIVYFTSPELFSMFGKAKDIGHTMVDQNIYSKRILYDRSAVSWENE